MKRILLILLVLLPIMGFAQTKPSWLQLKDAPMVDARLYGAKGDGTTDDTTAIQAWLNAIGSGHKVGFLPNGNYRITSDITLNDSASIVGESRTDAVLNFTESKGGLKIHPANTPSSLPGIALPVTPGSRLITFVSHHGLAVGDTFIVNDSAR